MLLKALIVEDDMEICDIIKKFLTKEEKYTVEIVHDAENALQLCRKKSFDIILLDIMLPGMDGINLCAQLRRYIYCPIIFISALNDDETLIKALQMGGDDYLTKPFRCQVLLAKIDAVFRRINQVKPISRQTITIGDLQINEQYHSVSIAGENIYLSPTEFQILMLMIRNRGRVLEMEKIYQFIWHRPSFGDLRTVKVHVHNLRKKIESDPSSPQYIKTVKNIGYVFDL